MEKENKQIAYERIYDAEESYLVLDDSVYPIERFDPEAKEFKENVAYLCAPYYYLYRGENLNTSMQGLRPGIYKKPSGHAFLVHPTNDDDKEKYIFANKIIDFKQKDIRQALIDKRVEIQTLNNNTKVFLINELPTDGVHKRGAKKILAEKEIDLDSIKDGFPDKNAYFNFKQVMKSPDGTLSLLIFERLIDAANLEYTITIKDKDPNNIVGKALKEPIIVSTEDTFK